MNPTTSSCRRCCVREKGARHPVHGDETLSRWLATERKVGGTLSRTWRGALNAGIRAEGADDKLAHALHPSRFAPFVQADLRPPPRIDHNIDVRRGTNPQAKRTSSACARLIWRTDTGTRSQATVSTDPQQDRKVGSLAEIRQSSPQGRVTHRDLRGQLAS